MNLYFGGCYVTISLRYIHTYVRTYPGVLHTISAVLRTVCACACLLVLHALVACVVNTALIVGSRYDPDVQWDSPTFLTLLTSLGLHITQDTS